MNKILFILFSLVSLQAPANICPGNTPATYLCACTAEWNKDRTPSPEEQTEENFYSFITRDVIGSRATPKTGSTYYYAGFQNADKALNMILNFILPAAERPKFVRTQTYKSDLMTVIWKENTKEKTVVKDGFAQIEVTFTQRGKVKYTVVFQRK